MLCAVAGLGSLVAALDDPSSWWAWLTLFWMIGLASWLLVQARSRHDVE